MHKANQGLITCEVFVRFEKCAVKNQFQGKIEVAA